MIFTNNFNDTAIDADTIPIFAQESFLKTRSKNFGWFYNDYYTLPVVFTKQKIAFLEYKSAYFTTPVIGKKDITEDEEKKFLYEVINKLKKENIAIIKQPMASALFKTYPKKAKECFFGTYKIDLKKDEAIIFSEIHSKHRNVIRKAEKEGVVIKKGKQYVDEAYSLIEQTYKRQNRKAIKYEKYLSEINNLQDNSEIYVSYHDNIPQSCAYIVYSKKSAYYLHGGMCEKPATGANNFLHWTVIKDMKEKGVEFYDFMGARVSVEKDSKLYGVQLFKKRFCKDMESGYLWKYVLNKNKYYLYTLLLFIKNRKVKEDTIDQERKKGNYNV